MLYQAYQFQSDLLSPFRMLAQMGSGALMLGNTEGSLLRKASAALDVFSRMRLTHSRPGYGIKTITTGERTYDVTEEVVMTMPFGSLLHFKKDVDPSLPPQPLNADRRRAGRCCLPQR